VPAILEEVCLLPAGADGLCLGLSIVAIGHLVDPAAEVGFERVTLSIEVSQVMLSHVRESVMYRLMAAPQGGAVGKWNPYDHRFVD